MSVMMKTNNLSVISEYRKINEVKQSPDERVRNNIVAFDKLKLSAESKKLLKGYSEIGKNVYFLSQKEKLEQTDIQALVDAFKSNEFFKLKPFFAKILAKESSEQVNTLLKAIFKSHAFDDSAVLFKKLNSLFTLQKIEQAIGAEFTLFEGAYKAAVQLSKSASRNFEAMQTTSEIKFKNTLKYYLSTTLDWFVESILFITQLVDVTDPDATMMEKQMVAQMRYQAFRDNLTIVSAGLIALAVYTGSVLTTIAVGIGCLVISIASYVVYRNYLKSCPDQVHPAINRTADATKGLISTVHGREEMVKRLFDTLEGNTKTRARRYPMIRGGTGIGKSDLGNAMALFLASPECPKEWKGKKLFVISSANIVTGQGHDKMEHLHHIKDVLVGHEDEAILFFTEAHVAFEPDTFFLGQELKTLCDAPGGFPYMIFATTDKEYMELMAKDVAFARRLEFFDVKPTKDEMTELIISDMILREAADICVSKEAIKEIATIRSQMIKIGDREENIFENCPQPATSIAITSKILANARHPWFKEQEQLLQELKSARSLVDCQLKLDRGADYLPYSEAGRKVQEQLNNLDSQINALETELLAARSELDGFRALVKKVSTLQNEIEKMALMITDSKKKGTSADIDLMKFVFLLNYLKPAMEESLKEMTKKIQNTAAVVDQEVAKEFIVQEAQSYLRKAQERSIAVRHSYA